MLTRLLDEIRLGGTVEPASLAARLGASTEMVKVMLEHLERLGWLQSLDGCAAQACFGCPLADTCTPKLRSGQLWRLKEN